MFEDTTLVGYYIVADLKGQIMADMHRLLTLIRPSVVLCCPSHKESMAVGQLIIIVAYFIPQPHLHIIYT